MTDASLGLPMEAVLCYVDRQWAYFTTQPLAEQWGDDWNDRPYEHNAGEPYDWTDQDGRGCRCRHPEGFRSYAGRAWCGEDGHVPTPPRARWEIVRVAYDGEFERPCGTHLNSPYSVKVINDRGIPWLQTDPWVSDEHPRVQIWAGTTLRDFIGLVHAGGGTVYLPMART